jgi:hypothetical protein
VAPTDKLLGPDACQLVRLWLHSNQDGRPDDARRVKNALP